MQLGAGRVDARGADLRGLAGRHPQRSERASVNASGIYSVEFPFHDIRFALVAAIPFVARHHRSIENDIIFPAAFQINVAGQHLHRLFRQRNAVQERAVDGNQILIFEVEGHSAGEFEIPLVAIGRHRPSGDDALRLRGAACFPLEMIKVVVAEQADAPQRFEHFEDSNGIGSFVEQVPQEHQVVVGCRSNHVQKRSEFVTAPVNVSDENGRHRGRNPSDLSKYAVAKWQLACKTKPRRYPLFFERACETSIRGYFPYCPERHGPPIQKLARMIAQKGRTTTHR
jgi:hypothetical protein